MEDVMLSPAGDIVLFEKNYLPHQLTIHFVLAGHQGIAFNFNFSESGTDFSANDMDDFDSLGEAILGKWRLGCLRNQILESVPNPHTLGKSVLGQWILSYVVAEPTRTRCTFTFSIRSQEKIYHEKIITGNAALKQQLTLVLKTALGELVHDTTFGSQIELQRHCNLRHPENLTRIQLTARKAFDQILSDYDLQVTYSPLKAIGYYSQQLTFIITTNNQVIIINEEV